MNFENSKYLLLLVVIPLYILIKYTKLGRNFLKEVSLPFPWLKLVADSQQNHRFALAVNFTREVLMLAVVASLIIALARPRGDSSIISENNLGVDIMLVTDISGSMTFVDEIPADVGNKGSRYIDADGRLKNKSRIEVAKRVMRNYIQKQEFNRIGLVLFSSYALTRAPLSSDKALLDKIVSEISFFEESATAIGTGILTGLNRIRKSTAKSKVIVLLTDGFNNAGIVDPVTAANVARELGVKIYTIGFGNKNGALGPIDNSFRVYAFYQGAEYDVTSLQEIADITGGKFFAAEDENALQGVYDEINNLEKSEIAVKRRVLYEEKFKFWLILASVFFALWSVLNLVIVKIP